MATKIPRKTVHPTREKLIMTMVSLLDGPDPEHITVEDILSASGVSRGSLYHHFTDFEELHETGLAFRITQWVDESVAAMERILLTAQSRDDVRNGIAAINSASQDASRRLNRLERARAFGLAGFSERFQAVLGAEQARLTSALRHLVEQAQERNWVSKDVDPMAVAVFIQAYTLGRVVDDISPEKVDPQEWNKLIMRVISSLMFEDE